MPQQSLGLSAKSVVKSVRMTPAQEKILISKYGTAQNALKQLLSQATRVDQTAETQK